MRTKTTPVLLAVLLAPLLALPTPLLADEGPAAPRPSDGAQWLRQLVGRWDAVVEIETAPGQPPLEVDSEETTRPLGQQWIVMEAATRPPARPYARVLILGYDEAEKRFVGTGVDTNSSHVGRFEGELDAEANQLVLSGELPHPFDPTRLVKVREVLRLEGPDRRTLTTSLQGEDGTWSKLVTSTAKRVD